MCLQRQIVDAQPDVWWAETPTVSGFNVTGPRRQSIDLIQVLSPTAFRAFELKSVPKTNNPIFATVELIKYALVYAAIRSRAGLRSRLCPLSARLLDATHLEFAVVAPSAYYEASFRGNTERLVGFGSKVAEAFHELGEVLSMHMDFGFRVFDNPTAESFLANRVLTR